MENEEKLNIATKRWLDKKEMQNTFAVPEDSFIKKILTLTSEVVLNSVTPSVGSVKLDGYVAYKLLIVNEDDEILPLFFQSSFSQMFELANVDSLSKVSVKCSPQNIKAVVNDSGVFTLSCDVTLDMYLLSPKCDVTLAVAQEGVMTKDGEVEYMSLVACDTQTFTTSTSIKKDAKMNKVLFVKGMVGLKSALSSTDYYSLNALLCLNIVYKTEDGAIRSMVKEEIVNSDIAIDSINKDSVIQACLKLGDINIIESEDEFTFDVPLTVISQVYNKEIRQCVLDAYSVENEVNLTTTSFEEDSFLFVTSAEESMLTTFEISSDMPQIDKILATVPTNIVVVNQQIKDGEILLEGIASFNIVYFSEDDEGNKILNSLDVDVPYSNTFNVKDLMAGDLVVSHICIKDTNIKSKHGKELEILAELFASFNISRTTLQAVTSNLTIGEVKPLPDYALEIYVANNEDSLWEIAKKLNISMSDLTMQNPNLAMPIKNGDKIVAFHKRNVD